MSALVLAVARIRSPSTLTWNKRSSAEGVALGSGDVELGDADGLTDALGTGEASPVGCGPKTPMAKPTATTNNTKAPPTTPTATRRG
jgi:hypothetical protein